MSDRRLMFVHAHPDDESSQSPATMSRYVDEGARVALVTYALGELGRILVSEWEHYTPEESGARRVDELVKTLKIVGVTNHVWLGGKGKYHDSSMATGDESRTIPRDELPDSAFWTVDLLEAPDHLVALTHDRRPQVIATYDQNGNYGHLDHIQTRRVTMYATMLAGVPSYRPDLGEPWQVSRVLWISPNSQTWSKAAEGAHKLGVPLPEGMGEGAVRRRSAIDLRRIAAMILYEDHTGLCQAALEAHRSQVDPENPLWKMFRFIRTVEGTGRVYRLVAEVPFPGGGPVDDLLASLDA